MPYGINNADKKERSFSTFAKDKNKNNDENEQFLGIYLFIQIEYCE
jgi:hypothetical protein